MKLEEIQSVLGARIQSVLLLYTVCPEKNKTIEVGMFCLKIINIFWPNITW